MKQYEDEIDLARMRISDLQPGEYLIGEIYGDLWPEIADHTGLGTYFKAMVRAGRIKGIEWIERRSDNNQLYRIF